MSCELCLGRASLVFGAVRTRSGRVVGELEVGSLETNLLVESSVPHRFRKSESALEVERSVLADFALPVVVADCFLRLEAVPREVLVTRRVVERDEPVARLLVWIVPFICHVCAVSVRDIVTHSST